MVITRVGESATGTGSIRPIRPKGAHFRRPVNHPRYRPWVLVDTGHGTADRYVRSSTQARREALGGPILDRPADTPGRAEWTGDDSDKYGALRGFQVDGAVSELASIGLFSFSDDTGFAPPRWRVNAPPNAFCT